MTRVRKVGEMFKVILMVSLLGFSILMGCLSTKKSALQTTEQRLVDKDSLGQAVQVLASDTMAGRESGSPGSKKARQWILEKMKAAGLQPGNGDQFEQVYADGVNLIALHVPQGSNQSQPEVLLTAHYDHLGSDCRSHPQSKSRICNGAADNAAGVVAILETVAIIAEQSQSPIAFAFWDGEEQDLTGSRYFLGHPTFDLSSLKLVINVDILGANLFRGLESHHFAIATETGGEALTKDVLTAGSSVGLSLIPLSYAFGHNRNDMTSFVNANMAIPFVFLTDAESSIYHSTADEFEHLNIDKIYKVTQLIAKLAVAASNKSHRYAYSQPQLYSGMAMPMFSDVVGLSQLIAQVNEHAERNQLGRADVESLEQYFEKLQAIQAGGVDHFGQQEALFLGSVALTLQDYAKTRPFVP